MSCRETKDQWCTCYVYRCPCGAPYAYDADSYHWVEEGGPCAECDRPMPDLACKPKQKSKNEAT